MKIRLSYLLGCEIHHLFEAQLDYAPSDPTARAALLALREIYPGKAWYFESDNRDAALRLFEHLRWIGQTADSIPRQTIAAARRTLSRVEAALKETA